MGWWLQDENQNEHIGWHAMRCGYGTAGCSYRGSEPRHAAGSMFHTIEWGSNGCDDIQ